MQNCTEIKATRGQIYYLALDIFMSINILQSPMTNLVHIHFLMYSATKTQQAQQKSNVMWLTL